VAAGFAVAATALVWVPEAHVAAIPGENWTEPCAPGWEMWVWGLREGPRVVDEPYPDPLWEKECLAQFATIRITTVSALSAAVLGVGGLVAVRKSERRATRRRDGSPTST
jgi:hypothetical protein